MHPAGQKAVLLMNLGSPDTFAVRDVKKYLTEFLMDKRVMDVNVFLRSWLVRGIIVPRRARSSAQAYKSIWTEHGSPLIAITQQLCEVLSRKVGLPVHYTMRYGNPTPTHALERLVETVPQLRRLIVIPMYPHYAMSSFETAVLALEKAYRKAQYIFPMQIIRPYYQDQAYIHALAACIRPYLSQPYDHILFSYHGVPVRHLMKGDPSRQCCLQNDDCCHRVAAAHEFCYRHQCIRTWDLVRDALEIPAQKTSVAFQSRLGKEVWLQPYTVDELRSLPTKNVKRLLVACPAFVSDCLETLEEIAEEGKKEFLAHGGEQFTMIPCLNLHESWVDALAKYVRDADAYSYPSLLGDYLVARQSSS